MTHLKKLLEPFHLAIRRYFVTRVVRTRPIVVAMTPISLN